jgi:phospholipid/cholesterol/gamma-HCH transport system substrate-binding protein
MKKSTVEIIVGLFICAGLLCMSYISIKLGNVTLFNNDYYPLQASFTTVAGLRKDTNVEISGVQVGKVESIHLDNYQAIANILIKNGVKIQDDAIASIRTKGILGDQYIDILPGASDEILGPGDMIMDTEPPFDLLSILKNFVVDAK